MNTSQRFSSFVNQNQSDNLSPTSTDSSASSQNIEKTQIKSVSLNSFPTKNTQITHFSANSFPTEKSQTKHISTDSYSIEKSQTNPYSENSFSSKKSRIKNISKANVARAIACAFIIAFIAFILAKPQYYLQSTQKGLALFATSVLPSLFPFCFCSMLLTYMGAVKYISQVGKRPIQALYGTPKESAYVLFLSMLCGYPVGASTCLELYQEGVIDKNDAKRICAFASTSGPIFIIGTLGGSIFKNTQIGWLVLLAHYLGAMINGLLYKPHKKTSEKRSFALPTSSPRLYKLRKKNNVKKPNSHRKQIKATQVSTINDEHLPSNATTQSKHASDNENKVAKKGEKTEKTHAQAITPTRRIDEILSETISKSTINMLFVGGYIVICGMLIDTLELVGIRDAFSSLGEMSQAIISVLYGAIEMTRGCMECAKCAYLPLSVALCTGAVSFGGLSITLQCYSFLSKCDVSIGNILLRKLTQAVISAVFAFLFAIVFII